MTTMNDVFTPTVLSLLGMTKEQVLDAANTLAPLYQDTKELHPTPVNEAIRVHFETPVQDDENMMTFPEFLLECLCDVVLPDPIPLTKAEIADLEAKENHRKMKEEGRIKSYQFEPKQLPVRFLNENEEAQTVEL